MEALGYARPSSLPGYVVTLLDGNVRAATAHRLKELRAVSGGALPGPAVVGSQPARHWMVDGVPCEDGHAQERSLLPSLVKTVKRGEGWVGDRNFCVTDFLFGITAAGGYFILREHRQGRFRPLAAVRPYGRLETGPVAAQRGVITDTAGHALTLRGVCVHLDQPTRDGDDTVYILPNLPQAAASPAVVGRGDRGRWPLETAFQILATALTSEINTRAYPQAALFGFSVAGGTYNVLATAKAALAQGHGTECIEREFSDDSLAAELAAVAAGMEGAWPAENWHGFRLLPVAQFAACLLLLAQNVRLARFKKPPRGPKKPAP